MNLGERGRCERLGVDGLEDLVELAPEVALDDRAQRFEGPGGDGVVELAELVDEGLGQDVGARAPDLGGLGEGAGQAESAIRRISAAATAWVRSQAACDAALRRQRPRAARTR